ncbi:MAG: cobalamin-dependent protein [Proteobacteria bacterium]|nr:cobalamin-dependent protein [Pseudomonadota bacterium]
MARLLRTIEGEIIPRLLLALQSAPGGVDAEGEIEETASQAEVTEFARLVAAHDISVASGYLNALLQRGVPLEKIYLDVMAPAARLLGEWWKQDLRDFTEVTGGLCRMHQLLHEFSASFLHDAQPTAPDRCVLLVPMPGEQHSFGLIMVGEFFRRAGWDVSDPHPSRPADLLSVVRKHWFSLIGLSLSCESRMEELKPLLDAARENSRNQAVSIMVGGAPFVAHPEYVAAVGADATASDGRRAALEANRLIAARARRA